MMADAQQLTLRALRRAAAAALAAALLAAPVQAEPVYDVHFEAVLEPDSGEAHVRLTLSQPDDYARNFRFRVDEELHSDFTADGELSIELPFVTWQPPATGGTFELTTRIDRERNSGGYDARITQDYALLRADRLIPPARVRTRAGAVSRSTFTVRAPEGWSIETRYGRMGDEPLSVDDPTRRFSRPTGWMVAGSDLGVRRETVEGRRIVVAAPVEHGVRRMDLLAMTRWTLPALLEVFPEFPERLLIVSAGDPMWRGALSGPSSLYIHAERPLINERGTSTLVHELVHVAGISGTGERAGWIVEGLSDWFSLQVLLRSGVIGEDRYAQSLATLERMGRDAARLDARSAGGAVTARAVGALARIDEAIREATDGRRSLDDVARRLAEGDDTITLLLFRRTAEEIAEGPLPVFDELPLGQPSA